jgi:hypothetical protein
VAVLHNVTGEEISFAQLTVCSDHTKRIKLCALKRGDNLAHIGLLIDPSGTPALRSGREAAAGPAGR